MIRAVNEVSGSCVSVSPGEPFDSGEDIKGFRGEDKLVRLAGDNLSRWTETESPIEDVVPDNDQS